MATVVVIARIADLTEEAHAARADIGGRRVEQGAVVGEGNVVEGVVLVLGVEGAPAAVLVLHGDDPRGCSLDRLAVRLGIGPVERHGDDRRVVHVGVVVVAILEGPASRRGIRPHRGPVARDIENLEVGKPGQGVIRGETVLLTAAFHETVRGEPGVPDRRDAGLAVLAAVRGLGQQEVERAAGGAARRMIGPVAQGIEGHDHVGHRREDRAQAVLAVEARHAPV